MLLAYFMKNKFDVQAILNAAETKTSKNLRTILQNTGDKMAKPIDNGEPVKPRVVNTLPNFNFKSK